MNQNVTKNSVYDYLHGYRLSMVHLEEIQQLVAENKNTKYFIYKRLCELALNSRVINDKHGFIVEIDSEENRDLVDVLQKLFFVKVLKRATADSRVGNHTVGGEGEGEEAGTCFEENI